MTWRRRRMAAKVWTDREITSAISQAGERLGFQLRPRQQEVVLAFVKGWDIFVSLPTGSGEILCYSILPWIFDLLKKWAAESSVVVVMSPFIALMKDQVESLWKRMSQQLIACWQLSGVVFLPRKTVNTERDMFQSAYYRKNLVEFVTDEALCVKMWWVDIIY